MLKIVTIIGARPQIIKAAAISRTIKENYKDKIQEIIIHTGQHYDHKMSEIFFNELGIPKADYNLNVGSCSHGAQTALMLSGLEELFTNIKPNCVLLYGDTNSTIAGALAASKMYIPIAHVEAGLRSFNKLMPEEINRIVCDHVSTAMFCPTKNAIENLNKEGFNHKNSSPYSIDNPAIHHCGDIMYDNTIFFSEISERKRGLLDNLKINNQKYILTTIHRDTNTDNNERLYSIFKAILDIATTNNIKIVIPLHPRTNKIINSEDNQNIKNLINSTNLIQIIEPVSFLEMILLEKNSYMIITDSGGVQKEAYFLKKYCIILRPQTEWVEIVQNKAAIIADANYQKIIDGFDLFNTKKQTSDFDEIFGNGKAANYICEQLLTIFK
ncbi:MAG: UDP-N-acetylglucosamine 2-epimerase [Bacteroidetes bacterium GWE2_29_8]|nr:MAG: UDP-N-acetylglucosamine 2-epimerase [Bacteroidetes bacterium GWE2_29_8]OFY20795.1 MAG: UDP-N-acetylglucosamine 2-epimerase [Bacteroidetes bacterium GWF2_29_10]